MGVPCRAGRIAVRGFQAHAPAGMALVRAATSPPPCPHLRGFLWPARVGPVQSAGAREIHPHAQGALRRRAQIRRPPGASSALPYVRVELQLGQARPCGLCPCLVALAIGIVQA